MASKKKYADIHSLAADEASAASQMRFSIVCKHEGVQYTYDLSNIGQNHPSIVRNFASAIFRTRHSVGHRTREQYVASLRIFIRYLNDPSIDHPTAFRVEDIDERLLQNFSEWLKKYSSLSYQTASSRFNAITRLLREINRHLGVPSLVHIPSMAFPNRHRLGNSIEGYSEEQFRKIIRAVASDLRENSTTLERPYIPTWLNRPPPIDDILPFDPDKASQRCASIWKSHQYRLWWWENNCSCQRLSSAQIMKIRKGTAFYQSFSENGKNAAKNLYAFYDMIGAGPSYIPKFLGARNPIKYRSRWQKFEYVHWYWENVLRMGTLENSVPRRSLVSFRNGIASYHHNMASFHEKIGHIQKVSFADLVPYFIMLLARTALNPATIANLTTDCLVKDPSDANRWMIEWKKVRAFKTGKTIPVSLSGDTWVPAIIRRVVDITAQYRKADQKNLWLTSQNSGRRSGREQPTPQAIRHALKAFAEKHDLFEESSAQGNAVKHLSIHPRKFRPTIAMMEYVRTEDLIYIQELLGHKSASMTASYIIRTGDPVLRMRRGLHLNAMMIGLTDEKNTRSDLMKRMGLSLEQSKALLIPGGEHEALLNHCSSPRTSPYLGQKDGTRCTAGENCCLTCQNLLITPEDIVKYFSYEKFHLDLLAKDLITQEQFDLVLSEKRFIWENQILPQYSADIVERCRNEAHHNPTPEWRFNG